MFWIGVFFTVVGLSIANGLKGTISPLIAVLSVILAIRLLTIFVSLSIEHD